MNIDILYFASLKEITGKDKESINLSNGNTIEDLIKIIIQKYEDIGYIIWDFKNNNLKGGISIAVNDKILKANNEISFKLQDNDIVAILLPFSGG